MWRSLIRPRRLVLLAITLLVSVTCIRLGIWQWHRLQERRAYNEAVAAGMSKAPTPLSQLVPAGGARDGAPIEDRRVVATRTHDGSPGVVPYGRAPGEPARHPRLTPPPMPGRPALLLDPGGGPLRTSA